MVKCLPNNSVHKTIKYLLQMAKEKMVIEGSDKVTASQMKELFTQIADGTLSGHHIKALLDHRNPFPWCEYIGEIRFGKYYEKVEVFQKEVIGSGASIDACACQGMEAKNTNFGVSIIAKIIPLMRTSVSHFGFESASYSQIRERVIGSVVKCGGKLYSIELCPYETAAYLAIQHYSKTPHLAKLENYEEMTVMSELVEYKWTGHNCKSLMTLKRVDHEVKEPSYHISLGAKVNYGDSEESKDLNFYTNDLLVFALHEL